MVLLVQRRSRAQIAGPGRYQFRPGMRKPKAIARGIRTTVPLKVRGRLGRVALVIPKPYIYIHIAGMSWNVIGYEAKKVSLAV